MNWTYIIGGVAAGVGLLTLVYNLTARRSDATIKALETHNKWLREQLDLAKETSPDILVKTLSERGKILEEEVKRLSLDRETNQAEIKKKEAEIEHNKNIAKQINAVMQEFKNRYNELKEKVDVCPYCDAGLVELKDVNDEDWTGSLRSYACGYAILDGDMIFYCPSDPEYPLLDEFDIQYQERIMRDGWTATTFPKTAKAKMVKSISVFGRTKGEAQSNLTEVYYQNPAKRIDEHNPIF
jgi:hypothetical protein